MSREMESAILGAAILDAATLDIAGSIVSPQDFTDTAFGQVFALMTDMHRAGEPVGDHGILVARLQAAKMLDGIGGVAGIAKLATAVPNVWHIERYAEVVANESRRRKFISLAMTLSDRASDQMATPAQIAEWLDGQLAALRTGSRQASQTLAEATQEAIEALAAAKLRGGGMGLSTGLYRVDEATGGFHRGELVILAARPSIGKSAMGVQFGIHSAERNRPAMFVTLEMTGRDIALRQLASRLGLDVRDIRNGLSDTESARAVAYQESLRDTPFHLWTSRKATMAKIRAAAKVQKATTGLDILIVDYLGLITPDDRRKQRWEQVSESSAALKSLAMELQIPVLVLCQLGREAEKMAPRLDHLRDSGSIEQDADVVMLLHRESRDSQMATLDIAKNRNGATGVLSLGFNPGQVTFTDAPEWEP